MPLEEFGNGGFHSENESNVFRPDNHRPFWIFLRKTRSWKSRDYRDVIVLEKLCFQMVSVHTLQRKAGVFKFFQFTEEKLSFREGFVQTVRLPEK